MIIRREASIQYHEISVVTFLSETFRCHYRAEQTEQECSERPLTPETSSYYDLIDTFNMALDFHWFYGFVSFIGIIAIVLFWLPMFRTNWTISKVFLRCIKKRTRSETGDIMEGGMSCEAELKTMDKREVTPGVSPLSQKTIEIMMSKQTIRSVSTGFLPEFERFKMGLMERHNEEKAEGMELSPRKVDKKNQDKACPKKVTFYGIKTPAVNMSAVSLP